jgi:hypothetical protein
MDRCDGGDLDKLIKAKKNKNESFTEQEAIEIVG